MLQVAAWLYGRDSRNETRWGARQPALSMGVELARAGPSAPLGSAGTPFLRALERKPELSPVDATRESLDAWMAATGATPDDVEIICELRGWALPGEFPETLAAPEPEPIPEPPKPVKPAILEFPEKPEPPEIAVDHRTIPGMPARRELEAHAAAVQFIEWVRFAGKCGTYSHTEFSELCTEFFQAEDIFPIPENTFRPVLVTLRDDITKSQSDDNYRHGRRSKRSRHFRWTVHESDTESDSLPWTDLPEKQMQAA